MRMFIGAVAATMIALLCLPTDAQANRKRNKTVAEYERLRHAASCAQRRVVQAPLWGVPVVGQGIFILTFDCEVYEAERAEGELRAYMRKNRIREQ